MATQPRHGYTFEEYLELERKADFKSEYRAGHIIAMSGGTGTHSELAAQIIFLLKRAKRCRVFDSNLRLYIEHYNRRRQRMPAKKRLQRMHLRRRNAHLR